MSSEIQTVGVVIFKDNKVLLVKHTEKAAHITASYGLPSGRVEEGESLDEAAMRELQEETGLTAKVLIEFPGNVIHANVPRKSGEVVSMVWTLFICTQYTGQLHESDETIPEWVTIEDLGKYKTVINVPEAIQMAWNFLHKK